MKLEAGEETETEGPVAWIIDKMKMLATFLMVVACMLVSTLHLLVITAVVTVVIMLLYPPSMPWLATTHAYIPVFVAGGAAVLVNYYVVFQWFVWRKTGESGVPCVGGMMLALGFLMQPVVWLRYFAWVGFILDYTWLSLVYSIIVCWDDWKTMWEKQPEEGEGGVEGVIESEKEIPE